jgi:hypothetical protein
MRMHWPAPIAAWHPPHWGAGAFAAVSLPAGAVRDDDAHAASENAAQSVVILRIANRSMIRRYARRARCWTRFP